MLTVVKDISADFRTLDGCRCWSAARYSKSTKDGRQYQILADSLQRSATIGGMSHCRACWYRRPMIWNRSPMTMRARVVDRHWIVHCSHYDLLSGSSEVVVLGNRTTSTIRFSSIRPNALETHHRLDSGAVLPLSLAATMTILFDEGQQPQRRPLQANGIYYFQTEGGKLGLLQYPLPAPAATASLEPAGRATTGAYARL